MKNKITTPEQRQKLKKKAEETSERLKKKGLGPLPDWMIDQNFRDCQRISFDKPTE